MTWPPTTTTCMSCTARARKVLAPPISRVSSGASTTATAYWSRWMPTARTSPRNCPGCSPPSRAPISSSAPAGCPAAAPSTGPSSAGSSPRRQHLLPAGAGSAAARYHRRLPGLSRGGPQGAGPGRCRLAGLLLPGRPGPPRRTGRLPRRRSADHLRRARVRRQQDEPGHRCGGAVARHGLGRRLAGGQDPRPLTPPPPAARCRELIPPATLGKGRPHGPGTLEA